EGLPQLVVALVQQINVLDAQSHIDLDDARNTAPTAPRAVTFGSTTATAGRRRDRNVDELVAVERFQHIQSSKKLIPCLGRRGDGTDGCLVNGFLQAPRVQGNDGGARTRIGELGSNPQSVDSRGVVVVE